MGNKMGRARQMVCPVISGAVVAAALASGVQAQSASSSMAAYSRGYGSNIGSLESPVNVSTTDANGNTTIVNGVMQAASGSIFSNLTSLGASNSSSGAGSTSSGSSSSYGSATAIGNNLNVQVSGSYNTVIVNSTQTNTGAVSATTVLNGKVNLDGGE
jgi:holdfast attachment protein HfaA